ncbi:MAG: M17 family peptidase N-terminal domain-containing protein, partial [Parasphingorhabdus sp.]
MNFNFANERPADADAIIFAIANDGLNDFDLGLEQSSTVKASAKAARFGGTPGEVFETFVTEAGEILRVVLTGVGKGKATDAETAGGSAIAKILASGAKHAVIAPSDLGETSLARLLFGAKLRSWRHDKYRTTMPEKQKVTLATITVLDQDIASAKAWQDLSAVADGVALTRELVAEPANTIYPESFVARCEELKDLGVEFTVLGWDEMEKLGMGALLGVSQGSERPPRLLAMRWD